MMLWCLLLSTPPFLLAFFLDWMRSPSPSSTRAPMVEGRVFPVAHPARTQTRRGAPASVPKLLATRPVERRERAAYRERLASGEQPKASSQPRSLEREARKS
ncbi:MAG TPA: hypothetical protein VGM06_03400 [Polyangiaceae bacterium]|jgi:hypothetical protein